MPAVCLDIKAGVYHKLGNLDTVTSFFDKVKESKFPILIKDLRIISFNELASTETFSKDEICELFNKFLQGGIDITEWCKSNNIK